ncbi:hypothetical protein QE152_g4542 [Popillia japonica]|uniref:Uncharacterized protein n=1 Tax=Popillia japonica TaxID=7064 RepID=A0AAW1MUZ5_POPJA
MKRAQTSDFLKEDIDSFSDAKNFLSKSPENSIHKATHIIKDRIVNQSDLPDKDLAKLLDHTEQVREDAMVKEKLTHDCMAMTDIVGGSASKVQDTTIIIKLEQLS